ncbi:TspO/MBR family protein [Fundicoccus sp. Sow4_H7]|uniref:TspO/MBR family protein n=1 Tax=Fundicoccus sp. Sow4_H7 TaxID=3438784 RepID=UPI003F8FD5EF
MKNTKMKSWINLIVFIVTLFINALGSLGYINGMSQKAVSDKYHTLITPAPFTFSIWGLIYLLVLFSLIMMIIKEKETSVKKLINIFTPIFLLSSILNILWIVTFSYEKIGISTVLIFMLLISLTTINKKLVENRREISFRLTSIAFGLYAGWLTIATVVNVSAFLVSVEWNGLGISPAIWAPVILFISIFIVLGINIKLNNAIYPLPIAWAYFGIFNELNREGNQANYAQYIKPVIIFGIIALLIASIIQFKRNNYCVIKKEKK